MNLNDQIAQKIISRKKTILALSRLFWSAIVVSACASTSTAATAPAAATQAPDVIDIGLAYSLQSNQDGLITPYKVIWKCGLNQAGAHYVVDSLADVAPVLEDIQTRLAQGEQP